MRHTWQIERGKRTPTSIASHNERPQSPLHCSLPSLSAQTDRHRPSLSISLSLSFRGVEAQPPMTRSGWNGGLDNGMRWQRAQCIGLDDGARWQRAQTISSVHLIVGACWIFLFISWVQLKKRFWLKEIFCWDRYPQYIESIQCTLSSLWTNLNSHCRWP